MPPEDRHLHHVIDTMALYVLDGGCAFEQAIMERGRGNPLFSFLFELGSKEHMYYVWRLYSFAQVCFFLCTYLKWFRCRHSCHECFVSHLFHVKLFFAFLLFCIISTSSHVGMFM